MSGPMKSRPVGDAGDFTPRPTPPPSWATSVGVGRSPESEVLSGPPVPTPRGTRGILFRGSHPVPRDPETFPDLPLLTPGRPRTVSRLSRLVLRTPRAPCDSWWSV